ncbi:hypothetical protein [Rhodococcus sp. NPDC076796]|uniref:hypothetical protein n=1 Tax=Rhodococcus sp. NPDC076796 TaxID=3154859 RepID=UPI00344CF21A
MIADRYGPVVATVCGGFVAGYSIRESLGQDLFHIESSGKWYGAFVTAQWAGTLAVMAAVVVLAVVHRRRPRVSSAVAAVLGAAVIALPSFAPIASNQAVTTNALGAGVLVGICGFVAGGRRLPSAGIAVGLLARCCSTTRSLHYADRVRDGGWTIWHRSTSNRPSLYFSCSQPLLCCSWPSGAHPWADSNPPTRWPLSCWDSSV